MDSEYARNKAIGEATGCWKHGTLVEDDGGSVARYRQEQAAVAAAAAAGGQGAGL